MSNLIVVLMGGLSGERKISFLTGKACSKALKKKGYRISGSDDNIFEPSKSRLKKEGVLPKEMGWFPEKITTNLDAIILGMHAKIDNPELKKAKRLNIPIYSFPEYIYNDSKDK